MLEIEPCAGITDYLMGEVEADQIRMQTTIHPNLHLIPSGTMVDEPSELLVNGRLEQLLNYLDTKYDVLMIDTAPLLALSDASVIAPNVNLILYIVRHNHTPKGHIEMLDENMRSYQLENVAIVFNGVKTRGFSKKGYGYGYGYGNDAKSNYDGYMKKKKVA
jgi:Mrp family chromosome partitioning ATPase